MEVDDLHGRVCDDLLHLNQSLSSLFSLDLSLWSVMVSLLEFAQVLDMITLPDGMAGR